MVLPHHALHSLPQQEPHLHDVHIRRNFAGVLPEQEYNAERALHDSVILFHIHDKWGFVGFQEFPRRPARIIRHQDVGRQRPDGFPWAGGGGFCGAFQTNRVGQPGDAANARFVQVVMAPAFRVGDEENLSTDIGLSCRSCRGAPGGFPSYHPDSRHTRPHRGKCRRVARRRSPRAACSPDGCPYGNHRRSDCPPPGRDSARTGHTRGIRLRGIHREQGQALHRLATEVDLGLSDRRFNQLPQGAASGIVIKICGLGLCAKLNGVVQIDINLQQPVADQRIEEVRGSRVDCSCGLIRNRSWQIPRGHIPPMYGLLKPIQSPSAVHPEVRNMG